MNDSISRAEAIEAVLELNIDGRVSWKDAVIDTLDALPSAETSTIQEKHQLIHQPKNGERNEE